MDLRLLVGLLSACWRWLRSGGYLFEFHRFSFDISNPLPEGAIGTMLKGRHLLNTANMDFRFTDGTALGFYREGNFIAHDNDIDVDLLDCNDTVKLMVLFLKGGFSIGRFVFTNGRVQQIAFFDKSNIVFDIVFWWSDHSDQIFNYSEPGFVRSQNIKYFKTKTEFPVDGSTIPLPGHIEEWLISRYGIDWMTPKKYKGDWRDDCHDITRL